MAAAIKSATLTAKPADGPLAAASLVTTILKHCGSKSLEELYESVRATDPKVIAKLSGMVVTEDQFELIESYGDIVAHLRTGPTTSIALCDKCGKTTVITGTPPKKCALTLGCEGTPQKSAMATKTPVVADVSAETA